MLIEFSVANFCSFRERQTFSMVAASKLRKKENTFKAGAKGEKLPDLLKVAAIYGPNASGKSSLVKALDVIPLIAARKPSAISYPLPVKAFRFDPALSDQPSEFEIHFVHNAQRYEFAFAATSERIFRERLIAFPSGKETLFYDRIYTPEGDKYEFGQHLEGGEALHIAWQKLTGPQALFLAQAVANSSENLVQLRAPFEWLTTGLRVMDSAYMKSWAKATQDLAQKAPHFIEDISQFLQSVDVPVTNMHFEPVVETGIGPLSVGADAAKEEKPPKTKTRLTHRSALGEAQLEFEEESRGTQNLIGFWLPWGMLADESSARTTLVVDELDSSLHPKIVADLIEKHIGKNKPGQIIFTTHDTHLMDTKLLRRDQIWITERDLNGATKLRSVHDFEGRESEDVEKRYFEGRYRGLPILRKK